MRACLAGWGTAVPEQRLTNAELETRVDTTDEWIVERTGIRERRVATPDETTASLAVEASAAAIKHAGLTPDAIDLLIVATCTPEQPLPHTGAFVGDKLGMQCGSFDLTAACAGFLYGLVVGSSMIQAGGVEHVLVVGSEVLTRIIDPYDRGTCILFGDGAGRIRASRSPDDGPGLLSWELGLRRLGSGLLEIPSGGSRRPTTPETVANREHFMRMNGPEVFRQRGPHRRRLGEDRDRAAGVDVDDIDWFVPAPGERPYHRVGGHPARHPAGAHPREHRPLRQHERGVDPAHARGGGRRRPPHRR